MSAPLVILGLTCLTGTFLATAIASVTSARTGDSPVATHVPADDPPPPAPDDLALTARYGGFVGGVTATGDHALASYGFRVHEYDLSDPSAPKITRSGPTVAGRPALLPGNLSKMVQRGGWTYGLLDWDRQVPSGEATRLRLAVLDADLSVAGTLELPGFTLAGPGGIRSRALELALFGDHHLMVAESEPDGTHLRLIDVSRPAVPVLAGDYRRPDEFERDMAVSGDFAYLIVLDQESRDPYLFDVDFSNPSAPRDSAPIALGDRTAKIGIGDGHAFVAGCEGIDVYSLADPSDLLLVGALDLRGTRPPPGPGPTPTPGPGGDGSCSWAAQPTWRDGFLYFVSTENLGFFTFEGRTVVRVFDVRRPEAPVLVGQTRFMGATEELAVGDGFGIVAGMSQGMGVVSLARPDQPQSRGPLVGGRREIGAVAAAPDLIVQGTSSRFDSTLEFIVPGRGIVGTFNLGREDVARAIAIQGGWVYAIIDKTDERMPEVRIVDARDPAAPRAAGTIPALNDTTAMTDLAIDGDSLWITDGGFDAEGRPVPGGIRVFDIRERSRPIAIGRADGSFVSVAAGDDVAFAGSISVDDPQGVDVFSVSQLSGGAGMEAIGSLALESPALSLSLSGKRLYARTAPNGLHVVDVSTPSRPRVTGALQTVGACENCSQVPFSLATRGDLVYAGSYWGLETIDAHDPAALRTIGFRQIPSVRQIYPAATTLVASGGQVAATDWDVYYAGWMTGLWAFRANTPLARVWLPWAGGGP